MPKALYCFSNRNILRRASAQISEHRYFEYVIIIFILANCICMASRDYLDQNDETKKNQVLNTINFAFSGVFILEAMLKILTSGFIFDKKAYLRDYWNMIDFLIVVAAIIDIIVAASSAQESDSLQALRSLRVLRVLRPLKAVKSLPSLRKQVAALLKSLQQLANVMAFLLVMFFLFGIMGL